jgi:hypothetical protein
MNQQPGAIHRGVEHNTPTHSAGSLIDPADHERRQCRDPSQWISAQQRMRATKGNRGQDVGCPGLRAAAQKPLMQPGAKHCLFE